MQNQNDSPESEASKDREGNIAQTRPLIIEIVCLMSFCAFPIIILFVYFLLTTENSLIGYYPALPWFLIISSTFKTVCLIGVWKMKRIGAVSYAVVALLDQIPLLAMGLGSYLGFLISAALSITLLYQSEKMKWQ